MNYAATLAALVVLAFCFPLTVRIGTALGIPEAWVVSLLSALLVFGVTAYLVRWQVQRHSVKLSRLAEARAQIATNPDDPRAYFVQGEHLGKLLIRLGRRREAAEVIDRYSRLGGARESEIVALREALSQAEGRKRRAEREVA